MKKRRIPAQSHAPLGHVKTLYPAGLGMPFPITVTVTLVDDDSVCLYLHFLRQRLRILVHGRYQDLDFYR